MKTLNSLFGMSIFSGLLVLPSITLAAGNSDHKHMNHSNMKHHMNGHHMGSHEMSAHEKTGHEKNGHHMMHDHKLESATGSPGNLEEVTKTIRVDASDSMKFDFKTHPEIVSGDVVKFLITNTGMINHEFSVGNQKEQTAHQAMMRKMPNMVHEDGNSVTVKPGETRSLVWKFEGDRDVVFACNILGHSEAGMIHKVKVKQK